VETRGRRTLAGFLVFLAVLCCVAGVADRVAAHEAQNRIADAVRTEANARGITFAGEPEVSVGGYPFLTQAVSGKYNAVTITLHDVVAEGVRIPELTLYATDIDAPLNTVVGGDGSIVAQHVRGTGVVDLRAILSLVNEPGLTLAAEGDRLKFRVPLQIAGVPVPLVGTGRVAIVDGRLKVALESVQPESGQQLPAIANQLLEQEKRKWSVNLPLPILPFQLTVHEARISAGDLVIDAEAQAVTLAR
jgi:hypothetical protein